MLLLAVEGSTKKKLKHEENEGEEKSGGKSQHLDFVNVVYMLAVVGSAKKKIKKEKKVKVFIVH